MTDNHCWYRLNIDVTNIFNKNWKMPVPTGQNGVWSFNAQEIFDPEWLEHAKSIGLPFLSCMVFYRGPKGGTPGAHVDLTNDKDPPRLHSFGINMILGGAGSEMIWYELPHPVTKAHIHYTDAKTPYVSWPISALKEIERKALGPEITMVRTHIPHAIVMKDEPRWCFSARMAGKDDISWDDVVKALREKNILVERDD